MRRLFGYDELAAFLARPSRNAVPPPQLSGNTPILDVFHPVKIDFGKPFRYKLYLSAAYRFDCRLCQGFHGYEPLLAHNGLYRRTAAVTGTHVVGMLFYLHQRTHGL